MSSHPLPCHFFHGISAVLVTAGLIKTDGFSAKVSGAHAALLSRQQWAEMQNPPCNKSLDMLQNQAEPQVLWDSANTPLDLHLGGKADPPGLGSDTLVGFKIRICSGRCNNSCIFTLLLYSLRNNKAKPLCWGQQDFTRRGHALSPASPLTNHLTAARDVTGGELCLSNRSWQHLGSHCPFSSGAFPASHQVEHRSPSPLVALKQH